MHQIGDLVFGRNQLGIGVIVSIYEQDINMLPDNKTKVKVYQVDWCHQPREMVNTKFREEQITMMKYFLEKELE